MNKHRWILLAEDNANDADLAMRALSASQSPGEVVWVGDGAAALDCLHRRGTFQSRNPGPPTVVLLDLKMPKVDGLEVLRQIKADAELRTIPVVVFTSSRERTDLLQCYHLSANAYVVKPVGFQEYVEAVKEVRKFWMGTNEAPPEDGATLGLSQPQRLAAISPDAFLTPARSFQTGGLREKHHSHPVA